MPKRKTVYGARRGRPRTRVLQFEVGASSHHHDLYSDPRWRALRAAKVAQHGEVCCDPEHDNRYPRSKAAGAKIELDHVHEVRDAPHLALDINNTMLRCRRCHQRKTIEQVKHRNELEFWERRARQAAERKADSAKASDGEQQIGMLERNEDGGEGK